MPVSSLTGLPFGTLPGAAPQGGSGAYGSVPRVPDPTATQAGAIGGNVSNLGSLYGLTGQLNQQIAQQAPVGLNTNLPGYQNMIGQSSQNILSQLQGQVPQDVANQISQIAAERGVATGSIGSPNANTALLRALGLTSIGQQQQGEQNLTGAIARTPTGQLFDPRSFLTTPSDQQSAQYAANLYAAAPDPSAAARAGLKTAQQGLGAGLSIQHNPAMGGGGNTDALGFPVDNFMQGGVGVGPGQVSGNSFGSTISRSGGWGLGNASTPFSSASGALPWQTGPDLGQGDWTMWGGAGGTGAGGYPPNTFTDNTSSTYNPYGDYGSMGGFQNDLNQGFDMNQGDWTMWGDVLGQGG